MGRTESFSNIERFLKRTTPLVKVQYIGKSSQRKASIDEAKFTPSFTLGDLWASFEEWSAYGVGVPTLLNRIGTPTPMQYYAPYLSAIQIYAPFTFLSGVFPLPAGENGEYHDASRVFPPPAGEYHDPSRVFFLPEGENGYLIFEHFEDAPLDERFPFFDQMLSGKFKDLGTLRSTDLLPSSWVSIAWNRIISIGGSFKDTAACFLSYHPLSTILEGLSQMNFASISLLVDSIPNQLTSRNSDDMEILDCHCTADNDVSEFAGSEERIALKAFGLASYKLQESATRTLLDPDPWLNEGHARNPDYDFFFNSGKSLW